MRAFRLVWQSAPIQWLVAFVWIMLGARYRAIRRLDRENGCLVFFGHNPESGFLDTIIRWFKRNGFRFISQAEVLDCLENGRKLPPRSIWLTLDDGWRGNVTEAFPVLLRHRVPATVFLSTRSMETGYFWFDVTRQEVNAPYRQVGRFEYEKLPNARRAELVDELVKNPHVLVPRSAMTVQDVKQWASNPLISFENHSHDHVVVSQCSEAELEAEIGQAAASLSAWTAKQSGIFAYPIGYHSHETERVLHKAGVRLAVTTGGRPWFPDKEGAAGRYRIPRLALPDTGVVNMVTCCLLGACPTRGLRALGRRQNA